MLSQLDPLKEVPEVGTIIRREDSSLRVSFPVKFDLAGSWRMDLGLPSLLYDRMYSAISCLAYDTSVFEKASNNEEEFILQGTELQDVLLDAFRDRSSPDTSESVEHAVTVPSSPDDLSLKDTGAFGDDQRIVSWVKRHMASPPIRMDCDPPIDLNESQMRAMAAMIGRRISLIQGVRVFIRFFNAL